MYDFNLVASFCFSAQKKMEISKAAEEEEEQVVNPWEVSAKDGGKIDYDKLIDKFGCQRLDQTLIDRIERLTSRPPHVFLRRGVFFAHRYDCYVYKVSQCLFDLEVQCQ